MISKQLSKGLATLESSQASDDAWKKKCADIADKTLLIHTSSWYMGTNVPGKKKEMLLYLGGVDTYARECKEALEKFDGFETVLVQRALKV